MRYIYYIVGIILLSGLAVLLAGRLMLSHDRGEAMLTVNGRTITTAEITRRQQYSPYHFQSINSFIDDLITRELLIQEARRRSIDREEPFRQAMQEHYEQALIKQLMDRRNSELTIQVQADDIRAYRECSQRRYSLEQLTYATADPGSAPPLQQIRLQEDFNDLPLNWQLQLLGLEAGQQTPAFQQGSDYCVLHISQVSEAEVPAPRMSDTDIRQLLEDANRQAALADWLEQLRREAVIVKSTELATGGEQH